MAVTFQIIGHKKSGKTTLVQNFLTTGHQYQFSVVKHTHLPIDVAPTNDTGKFFSHSDDVLLLNNEQTIHYQRNLPTTNLEKIQALQNGPFDFIVIEGIKELDFPKIVLLKPDESPEDFSDVTNVKLFVSIQGNHGTDVLDIEKMTDREKFIEVFLRKMKND